MDFPAVTREYTPGSCRKSRKPMRLPPRREMRPDSPALCPEQLRFPNQTRKEPRFAWLNSRESTRTLSQDEKNTDVTSPTLKTLTPCSEIKAVNFWLSTQSSSRKWQKLYCQGWTWLNIVPVDHSFLSLSWVFCGYDRCSVFFCKWPHVCICLSIVLA